MAPIHKWKKKTDRLIKTSSETIKKLIFFSKKYKKTPDYLAQELFGCRSTIFFNVPWYIFIDAREPCSYKMFLISTWVII